MIAQFSYDQIARVCHEANRMVQRVIGEPMSPVWDELPEWMRERNISWVEKICKGMMFSPAESHDSWVREMESLGWKHGPMKDEDMKEHPCLVPYEQLPQGQRMKDQVFWEIVQLMMGKSFWVV